MTGRSAAPRDPDVRPKIIGRENRQTLAVLPPGDARDILEGLGRGISAEPDVADIERAIGRLLALSPPARLADPEGKCDLVALAGHLTDAQRGVIGAARRAGDIA